MKNIRRSFGAAEVFGFRLGVESNAKIASAQNASTQPCPFLPNEGSCNKRGGVCSIAEYAIGGKEGFTISEYPVTVCPNRLLEGGVVLKRIAKEVLGTDMFSVLAQNPFLKSSEGSSKRRTVGRIDNVLVAGQRGGQLNWCAVEMQAVYFSGKSMDAEIGLVRERGGAAVFPTGVRRPDFRSSGPKRLMPQLQTKVPTISRWGKKTAVVVDDQFWENIKQMGRVSDASNADIIWFVVGYDVGTGGDFKLVVREVIYSTLQGAVEGLTGGTPVTLDEFDRAIQRKLELL